jgi:glycerophosphoryl diester phosphodiesterase
VPGVANQIHQHRVAGYRWKPEEGETALKKNKIIWQAHRGGGLLEAPDNTMAALLYGWNLGGIPEVDIRLTADDELICLHDDTLARTTDAPESIASVPVRQLPLEEIRKYDAGRKFAARFAGEKVLTLRDVFEKMKSDPSLDLFVDIKNYDDANFTRMLEVFSTLTAEYGTAGRMIVASCEYALNLRIGKAVEGARILQWIGDWGPEDHRTIKLRKFEELAGLNFAGLDGVQIHLEFNEVPINGWHYDVSEADLKILLDTCTKAGVFFQVFPFQFTDRSLCDLLRLGITGYATDEPARFKRIIDATVAGTAC